MCPINKEINGIFAKTVGLAEVVRHALRPVEKEIELALIYRSFAWEDYANKSDVDLLIVSEAAGPKLAELLGPFQNEIGRSINISQFSSTEYNQRKRQNDHFLTRVLEGPKIVLFGHECES